MKLRPGALRRVIRDRGLSYAEVGRATGRTRQAISQLARDKRSCGDELAGRLVQLLDVRYSDLFMPPVTHDTPGKPIDQGSGPAGG